MAILAAGELVAWGERWWRSDEPDSQTGWVSGYIPFLAAKLAGAALLVFFTFGPGLNFYQRLWTQQAYELPEGGVRYLSAR